MDSLEHVDWDWYFETPEEVKALSGLDRFGNYWEAVPVFDYYTELYQPVFTSRVGLTDGSWWNLNTANNPDMAVNILINDRKYNPE